MTGPQTDITPCVKVNRLPFQSLSHPFPSAVHIIVCYEPTSSASPLPWKESRLLLCSAYLSSFLSTQQDRVCRFIEDNEMKTTYPVVIGGENFGCGSSREHAPVALGASGGGAAASRLLVPAVLAARQTGKTVV